MAPARAMTEEQRRAMFARLNAGGGGGSATTPYTYDGEGDTETSAWKGFWKGFGEGALGGANIAVNNIFFGQTDKAGFTRAKEYLDSGETVWAASDLLSKIGATAAWTALGKIGGAEVGEFLKMPGAFGVRSADMGLKAVEQGTALLESWGATRVRNSIDDFREGNELSPMLDRGLGLVGGIIDFWGGSRTHQKARAIGF